MSYGCCPHCASDPSHAVPVGGHDVPCNAPDSEGCRGREATSTPRLGCSMAAHSALGFCGRCPELDVAIEATAWQVRHLGHPWTYGYALDVARAR